MYNIIQDVEKLNLSCMAHFPIPKPRYARVLFMRQINQVMRDLPRSPSPIPSPQSKSIQNTRQV